MFGQVKTIADGIFINLMSLINMQMVYNSAQQCNAIKNNTDECMLCLV